MRAAALLVTAAALLALSRPARADAGADTLAEALYAEGLHLMDAGAYDAACDKFAASLTYEDGLGTRGMLAECNQARGRTATAWAGYRDVAARARRVNDVIKERSATRRAAELEPDLSYLTVVPPPHAGGDLRVTLDGEPLASAALGVAMPVDPGTHVVVATAPGSLPYRDEVTMTGPGAIRRVTIAPLVAAIQALPATETHTGRTQRMVGAIAIGVGGAAALAGVYLGLDGRAGWNDAFAGPSPHCNASQVCDAVGYAQTQSAGREATIGAGLVIGGAAVAVTGVVLWAASPRERTPARRVEVVPVAAPGRAGLALRGRF